MLMVKEGGVGSGLMQWAGDVVPSHMRGSLLAVGIGPRSQNGVAPADALDARALAGVGLFVLVGLPGLILASLVVRAPLAGPAFIALGYLAIAHALTERQTVRAQAWAAAVFMGLTIWSAAIALGNMESASWPRLAAAGLAPLLAVAPAFARRFQRMAPILRDTPVSVAVGEQARGPAAAASVVSSGRSSTQVTEAREVILPRQASARPSSPVEKVDLPAPPIARQCCDIGEAIDFAVRHLARRLAAKSISLVQEPGQALTAACERSACRRTLTAVLTAVADVLAGGDEVRVNARRVRATVLIRLSLESDNRIDPQAVRQAIKETQAEAEIDRVGGSVILESDRSRVRIAIRLAATETRARVRALTSEEGSYRT